MKQLVTCYASLVFTICLVFVMVSAKSNAEIHMLMNVHDGEFYIPNPHVTIVAAGDTIRRVPADWGDIGSNNPHFWFTLPDEAVTPTHVTSTEPSPTRLFQNYPNPFNPSTTIEFTLETPAHASLTIYSIAGQRVRTLVDDEYRAGVYRSVWNGRDDDGRSLSAGIYFYRLAAGGTTVTRKMLLLDGGVGNSRVLGAMLTTGDLPAKKLGEGPFLHCDIIVKKSGYRTFTMPNAYLPLTGSYGEHAEIDVELTPETAPDHISFATGDSLLYASYTGSEAWSDSVEFQQVYVSDAVTMDGKLYHQFSEWPLFVPDIFHDDDAPALIRITDTGDLYILLFDAEIFLFNLSGAQFEHSFKTNEMITSSAYYQAHREKWNKIRGCTITTTLSAKGQVITTPGGVYENCLMFTFEIDSWDGYDAWGDEVINVFYDRDAGFVCIRKRAQFPPFDVLVGGTIGGERVGAVPSGENDSVTGSDIAEMTRLALECQLGPAGIYEIGNNSLRPLELVISSENIEAALPWLPDSICGVRLVAMSPQEIQRQADASGEFPVFNVEQITPAEDSGTILKLSYRLPSYTGPQRKDPYDMWFRIRFDSINGYPVGTTQEADYRAAVSGEWRGIAGDIHVSSGPGYLVYNWCVIDALSDPAVADFIWDDGIACTTTPSVLEGSRMYIQLWNNPAIFTVIDPYTAVVMFDTGKKVYRRVLRKISGVTRVSCF